jgi:hypothetical protein
VTTWKRKVPKYGIKIVIKKEALTEKMNSPDKRYKYNKEYTETEVVCFDTLKDLCQLEGKNVSGQVELSLYIYIHIHSYTCVFIYIHTLLTDKEVCES